VEAMNKFKVGDKIVRVNVDTNWAPLGYKTTVLESYEYMGADSEVTPINDCNWEIAKPKWTIYNNTLPWSELSDKQKGKLLLAKLNGIALCIVVKSLQGGDTFIDNIGIIHSRGQCVYRAQPEPIKPELTMETVFANDWFNECGQSPKNMIAKGWVKL
jgi:hypothetical protein